MTIKSNPTYISKTLIDSTLWAIQRSLHSKHGVDGAERIVAPLLWYINTGRASIVFLNKLITAKPFMVGRVLAKGGSYDEAIKRVKNYIGYIEEA